MEHNMSLSGNPRLLLAALAGCLVSGGAVGLIASAQTATDAMASYICRPAMTGETPNAKMTNSAVVLECKPIAIAMHMSDGSMKTIGSTSVKAPSGPDFSNALTAAQANAAYNAWVQSTFKIDPARVHTP